MQRFAEIKIYHSLSAISLSTILKNVPVWSPSETKGDVKGEDPEAKMTLAKFDLPENGQFLTMFSEGWQRV